MGSKHKCPWKGASQQQQGASVMPAMQSVHNHAKMRKHKGTPAMASFVEHIQYECSDLDRMAQFYAQVFDWPIRGRGREVGPEKSYDWIHVGSDESYVSFRTPYNGKSYEKGERHYTDHFGVVVSDLDAVITRLDQIGTEHIPKGSHPHRKRIYIRDPDGNEIEIIQYLSEAPSERNDYIIDAS